MRFLFDLIYPPRCPLCGEMHLKLCKNCLSSLNFLEGDFTAPHLNRIWFNRARSCVAYDGNIMDAIHALKYSMRFDLISFFSDLLVREAELMDSYDFVIPVPLHWFKLWRRGYNQSAMLARSIANKLSAKLDCSVLKKIKNISPQVGLSREMRLSNVKGAFDIKKNGMPQLKEKNVLLIDDVLTTGATANECAKILTKKAKVKSVDVLTIARTL